MQDSIDDLRKRLRLFADERHWDQYHSPKNLAMALIVEAAELVEHFQWMTEADSKSLTPEKKAAVEAELADIMIYLVRIADKLDVDLYSAAISKLEQNEKKYPADLVRGKSKKYNEY